MMPDTTRNIRRIKSPVTNRELLRILVVGHGTPSSGFGRVTFNLLDYLHREFEIHHFALNVIGRDDVVVPWSLYPNAERFDPRGAAQLPALVQDIAPALVFFIGERLWHAANVVGLRQLSVKTVLYCPIEGRCADPRALRIFSELDRLVVFTRFAYDVVTGAFTQLGACPGAGFPPIDVLPHGLALETFHRLPDQREPRHAARQRLLPHRPECHDGWWFLNANRTSPRKHLELTLQAFAAFSADKPSDVRLVLLHADESDAAQQPWLAQLSAENRLLTAHDFLNPIDDAQLNLLYNACEVGINSSSSEGWGLVAFEHGATGAAQIVPRHSSCQELWQEAGLLIDIESQHVSPNGMIYEKVAWQSLADHLESLYRSPDLLQTKSEAARRLATSSLFRWPAIAEQWSALLHETLARERSLP